MSQAIAIRVTTGGAVYAYGDKTQALADAGATDKVYEVSNPRKTLLCTCAGTTSITDNSSAFDGSTRHTVKLK